jgi:class 3 adenylate cyclase
LPQEDQVTDSAGEITAKKSHAVQQLADMSVISFLLLISGLKKARKLIKYNTHAGLRERLGDNYEVRLGLGLHIGYSIEGAIGSYYKIDASYLSSHPRMAERMEGATKHYGVPNLITEELYNYFTETTKSYCR